MENIGSFFVSAETFVQSLLTRKHVPCRVGLLESTSMETCVNFLATLWFPFFVSMNTLVEHLAVVCVQESYLCINVFVDSFPRNAHMSQCAFTIVNGVHICMTKTETFDMDRNM
jgi:hypothetical protein